VMGEPSTNALLVTRRAQSPTMGPPAFEIVRPLGPSVPVVAHVPHASTLIPGPIRAEVLLSDDELLAELLRLTDWHTDDLFAPLATHGITGFVNRLSRVVFDPERFLDDALEAMAAKGQGVVYWRGTEGQLLREPDPVLREQRIAALYRPYHAALDTLVVEMLEAFGGCTVLDCHSFPSLPLPSELDKTPGRPDICIGTDATHTPLALADAMTAAFEAEGFRVKRDSPFAGTFVPSGFYGRERRVRSVMVEVRRGLYIDEATAERLPGFDHVSAAIERAVTAGLASA
jgi:N-formylglutamate deformylase